MIRGKQDLDEIVRSRLESAVQSWQRCFHGLQSGDTHLHFASGLFHSLGEVRHLTAKLGLGELDPIYGTTLRALSEATSSLVEAEGQSVIDRLTREFGHDFSGYEQTILAELTPDNLAEEEMPTADRTEFEYHVLHMRDAFEFEKLELDRLHVALGRTISDQASVHDERLRSAIKKVMRFYRDHGYAYQDRPELYPQSFWWRALAWQVYGESMQKKLGHQSVASK